MLKIAVVDDEEIFAEYLKRIVSDYMSDTKYSFCVDIFTSGKEFVGLGGTMSDYRIVFLDIKMDQIDGIAVASKLREYSTDVFIIFVTAYISYTLEGYKVEAIRYILKGDPVLADTVHESLRAICKKIQLLQDVQMFEFKEGNMNLSISKIAYIETSIHKVIFHVIGQSVGEYKKYCMRETLSNIEERLGKYGFIRIHEGFLVNFEFIQSLTNYSAVLVDQTVLPVSRGRFRDAKSKFILYKGNF